MKNSEFPIRYITFEQWGGDLDAGFDKDGKHTIFTVQRGDGFGIITANNDHEKALIEAMPAFTRGTLRVLEDETTQIGKNETVFNDLFTVAELRLIKQLPADAKKTIKENILDICKAHFGDLKPADSNEKPKEEGLVSPNGYPSKAAISKMNVSELRDEYVANQLEGYDVPENFDSNGEIKLTKKVMVDRINAHYRKIEKEQ